MKRRWGVWLLVTLVVLASAGAGVAAYRWSRHSVSRLPEISAYSRGQISRVGPYFFCNVVNLDAQLAATIPTMDRQRGRLVGVVVQLMTLVRDQNGAEFQLPHAEWSVRLHRD